MFWKLCIYWFQLCDFICRTKKRGNGDCITCYSGSHVWIGANVSILPGVTIGDRTVIGAGSVVNKDIPSDVIAAGNPCRVIRKITEKDKEKYPLMKEE